MTIVGMVIAESPGPSSGRPGPSRLATCWRSCASPSFSPGGGPKGGGGTLEPDTPGSVTPGKGASPGRGLPGPLPLVLNQLWTHSHATPAVLSSDSSFCRSATVSAESTLAPNAQAFLVSAGKVS